MDSTAYCATAEVLNAYGASTQAGIEVQNAFRTSKHSGQQARNHVCLAGIQLAIMNEFPEAGGKAARNEIAVKVQKDINQALQWRNAMSPSLILRALRIKSSAESQAGLTTAALSTCKDIRLIKAANSNPADRFIPTDILMTEFDQYLASENWSGMMEMFCAWKPIERLTWLVDQSKYGLEQIHEYLLRAALSVDRVQLLIEIYDELIKNLDVKDCGAIWKPYLASTYWRVVGGDTKKAEDILESILDSPCNGQEFVLGGKDAGIIAMQAVNMLCDILYQKFRDSNDADLKYKLLERVKSLPEREMVRSLQIGATSTVPHLLVLARMMQKVGDPRGFERTLRKAFEICWENLHDSIIWNDPTNIRYLARVLGVMDSETAFREVIKTLLSFQLYYLGNTVEADSQDSAQMSQQFGDSLAPEKPLARDDDSIFTGDRDLLTRVVYKKTASRILEEPAAPAKTAIEDYEEQYRQRKEQYYEKQKKYSYYKWVSEKENWSKELKDSIFPKCQGPNCGKQWDYWGMSSEDMYVCKFCTDSILCEECFDTKDDEIRGISRRPAGSRLRGFCCQAHEFYTAPASGWEGIKDGAMILGYESISTSDCLVKVKDTWEEAWKKYWKG